MSEPEGVVMEQHRLMVSAVEQATRIVRGVPSDLLDAPTPCSDWNVRALINHMILWAGPGATAARKQPPAEPVDEGRDLTGDGAWADRYAERARAMAEAWADPAAWEGTTSLTGGPDGMPASFIGWMMTGECVLHGWDLAVSTGQETALPGDLVAALYERTVPTAEMGREYKVYAEELKVPESAPTLDRLLGLTGRDPSWRP
ncbi:TIGR03086 family protein [Actinomadura sp. NBRC 104412]|uniref:TIGR03086 family metal-binding protein n=1 Tax=Actinomadura sp. NBRC 104412 TaxID=3032203 RepID=UPI0024A2B81A|nr:TIGR03086 family metal-binding protein [Actinomadura sp. NBRC 104412]GLZ08061.1 TIGR03086 family protein [Actinomadura sp. NBRC 104412]